MSFATRVLYGLGEAFVQRAGPLVVDLVEGLSTAAETVDAMVATSPAGFPAVLDLDTTPIPGWVGQVTGTRIPPGLPVEAQRDYVQGRPNHKRGTPAALLAAVRAALNNDGTIVQLFERYGGPWLAQVRIFRTLTAAESAKVLAAATSQKPVGVILTVIGGAGATNDHMRLHHGTYNTRAADFGTYNDERGHQAEGGTTP